MTKEELQEIINSDRKDKITVVLPGWTVRRIYVVNRKVFEDVQLFHTSQSMKVTSWEKYVIVTDIKNNILKFKSLNND